MWRVVARIGRAHGIRGEVSIEVRTDVPGQRFVPGAVLTLVPPENGSAESPWTSLTIRSVREHSGTTLLAFQEVRDRSAAGQLRHHLLEAEVDDGPGEDDAWYGHELAGLRAVSPSGQDLGTVLSLEVGPAQDRLLIRRPDGQQRLVPFVRQLVPSVDVAAGQVVIDAPPGLLDEAIGEAIGDAIDSGLDQG